MKEKARCNSGLVSPKSLESDLDTTQEKDSDTESEFQLSETSEDRAFVVSDSEQLSCISSYVSRDSPASTGFLDCGSIANTVRTFTRIFWNRA